MHSTAVPSPRAEDSGNLCADWGIPTLLSIYQKTWGLGPTGLGDWGVRSGVDGATAMAVGGDLVGTTSPLLKTVFLKTVLESEEGVMHKIEQIVREFRVVRFCVGARSISKLQRVRNFERTHH